jgi:DNA adenine methylase
MEPLLKAVGGKRWLASKLAMEIMAISPELYVEPFVGGGAVTLTLPPSLTKIVADTNQAFIEVWRALRTYKPAAIAAELGLVYHTYPDTAFGYTKAKEELNEYLCIGRTLPASDRPVPLFLEPSYLPSLRFVALVLYVNARCFNGLWRVNSHGGMNVPWAKYKNPRRLTTRDLAGYHAALASTSTLCADFRQVLAALPQLPRAGRAKITIYADPPYDGTFASYTADSFDETDQRDLARWLKYNADLGMRVWTTNADTPLIRELYAWARIEAIDEYHSVGATGNRRGQRSCLLIRSH